MCYVFFAAAPLQHFNISHLLTFIHILVPLVVTEFYSLFTDTDRESCFIPLHTIYIYLKVSESSVCVR